MRLIPVMLALLLALSPGAVALQVSAPTAPASDAAEQTDTVFDQTDNDTVQPDADGNTTPVMTLATDAAHTAFDSPSLALGSSLAMDRGEFRTELSVNALDQQLKDADNSEKKKRILNRYRYRVENRIISLKAEEKRVTKTFSNGTISERDYLHALARIDAEAEELRNVTRAIQERADSIQDFGMPNIEREINAKLVALEGPVRDHISQSIRGTSSSARVYVETADTGVVLSTIIGGTYVREILRADRRDQSASGSMTLQQAQNRVFEAYPWAAENPAGGIETDPYGSNIYSVSIEHSHGTLVTYVDGGTEKVFKEVQYKRLTGKNSLPPGPSVQNTTTSTLDTSENVTLTVNRTYPGGPLRVKLTNETGAPLDGRITVAGEPVGRTNSNGVLWTLGPAEQFRVSATYEDTTVNVTATPVESES